MSSSHIPQENNPHYHPHNHPINLKVLRLSRPHIGEPNVVENDPTPNTILSLPTSFGNIYVGETFNCILSTNNVSDPENNQQFDVTVSASIQLPTQNSHVTLIHPEDPTSQHALAPSKSQQQTLSYEAQEPGLHILTITVSYRKHHENEEPGDAHNTTFRKHYQFTAAPGLAVKTKMSKFNKDNSKYTVEAQVENVSGSTMVLETAEFLPSEGWKIEAFPKPSSTYPLAPNDIYQAAFFTTRDNPKISEAMGKITISWRRDPVGQKGWLTTGLLKLPQKI